MDLTRTPRMPPPQGPSTAGGPALEARAALGPTAAAAAVDHCGSGGPRPHGGGSGPLSAGGLRPHGGGSGPLRFGRPQAPRRYKVYKNMYSQQHKYKNTDFVQICYIGLDSERFCDAERNYNFATSTLF